MPVTTHRFAAGDLHLAIHDLAPGATGRAPVLLVHPTGFHGRVWGPVADHLAAAGRHPWALDVRGHGDSDAPAIDYEWEGFADDVLAAVQHLDLAAGGDLVGVGHSSGGAALVLAESRAPGTFARLWLYEPIIVPADPPIGYQPDNPLAAGARKRRNQWTSTEEAIASYRSRPPLDALRDDTLRLYVEHGLRPVEGGYELKCRPEVEADVYARMGHHTGYRRLRDVRCPTTVAFGEHSDAIGGAVAPALVAALPDGRLEMLPGLGHFGPMQDPDAVAVAILRAIAPG